MTPRTCWVSLVLALLLAGCGGGRSYKTVPVSGRVTLDGKPLANAMVTFAPMAGAGTKDAQPSSVDTTDENGHYSLVLNGEGHQPGAVVGKHKVIIMLGGRVGEKDSKPTFHKQLPLRYNRKSELECEVSVDGRTDANFDLKSN